MIEKEKVNSIDFLRLFFALCIVAIHVNVMSQFSEKANWYVTHLVFRLGVPFFFVVTGYFLGIKFRKTGNEQKKCMRICADYIRKLLPPLLFWGFTGLIWYGITLVRANQDNIVWKVIQGIFFYPRAAMWYVLATIIAVLIIGAFWNHKIFLLVLAGGGYCFALLANTYYFVIEGTCFQAVVDTYMYYFVSARNFLGVGIIFIGMGIWLGTGHCFIANMKCRKQAVLLAIVYVIYIVEVWYTYDKHTIDDSSLFISLPLLALLIVSISVNTYLLCPKGLSKDVRRLSADIYFTHSNINYYIGTILFHWIQNIILRYLIIVICCCSFWAATRNSNNKLIRKILP